jgi:hypothetical protein
MYERITARIALNKENDIPAIEEFSKFREGFGRPVEGNHPHKPQERILYFEGLSEHQCRKLQEVCARYKIRPTFYQYIIIQPTK